jgi:hypothetical protein
MCYYFEKSGTQVKGGITMKKIRVTMLVVCCASVLYGARPFATDDAGTVEGGMYELESGITFLSDNAAVELGFKHGLTERMDIGFALGYVIEPEEGDGFQSAELGLKFALIPDLLAMSLTGSFGDASYALNGIVTQHFSLLEIDGNLGYEATGVPGEEGSVVYGLSLIMTVDPFAFGAEGQGDEDGFQSWLVGGRYAVLEGFFVDGGISGGFDEDSDITATVGLHYEF